MEDTGVLRVNELSKSYGEVQVITNIEFLINPGEIIGLVGHNGAGKTTILQTIVGLIKADSGNISFSGFDIQNNRNEYKRLVGFVSEDIPLYDYLTGMEYLQFIGNLWRIPKGELRDRIDNLVSILSLEDKINAFIYTYSKGMKQKLSLISALIHKPKLLVLDEPLTGLDPESSRQMKNYFRSYVSEGNSILFSSHILEVVEKLCDKIILIKNGRILIKDTIKNLTKKVGDNNSLEDVFHYLSTLKGGEINV